MGGDTTTYEFDLVVIGGGSGGSGAARRSALWGAKVALVDCGFDFETGIRRGAGVGGTCVNVGCIPKKLMFTAASLYESIHGHAEVATGNGITVGDVKFDWATLKKGRDAYVDRASNAYKRNWGKEGIEVVLGMAKLKDPHTVEVLLNDGEQMQRAMRSGATRTLAAKYVLVCVGGAPSYPDVPGAREYCITSDGFWDLEKQPTKAAVIGAGYIAVEMAGILSAFGTETTLVCRGKTPLRNKMEFDGTIVEKLVEEINNHGPTLVPNSTPAGFFEAEDGTITVSTTDGATLAGFDCVMLAIGRAPLTQDIGLKECGVALDKKGYVIVDEFERTNIPSILALGDCTSSGWELTPVALSTARRLGDRLFGGAPWSRLSYDKIPTVVFSHPPIGQVGLTEDAARAEFGDAVGVDALTAGGMGFAFNPDPAKKVKTTLKLVHVGDDRRIVGLHILGPFADEMIQGFAVAVQMGATVRDFHATVGLHPTMAEEIISFGGGRAWGLDKDRKKPERPPYADPTYAKPVISLAQASLGAALLAALAFAAGRFIKA
ncbi:hypothetical protein CTAYLR_010055 [Chrysophaeum taylorii]|uniref:Glutathione-disulfide reductase n=1 Tax=Chrysophaeum taylorii TaxID=2483200 RepID=A0AAD7UAU4_9STRA|nr:hypothetical protein CTAYLR_010055 [Chrysophaeum taylorii]